MKYLWMAVTALFVPMFLSAQDADYMKLRSTILPEERDDVGENGFRAVHYVGLHASSLLSFNAYGSTGIFQMEAMYWGDIRFRNKVDGVNWNAWKTIYHEGNFNPADYMKSLVNTWNTDVTGRHRFFFGTLDNNIGSTTYIKGYGNDPLIVRNGDDVSVLKVGAGGELGVGTTETHGYKLAVAGGMIAEKVTVKMQSAWPDYVFHKDYPLPSLQEVERYIQRHQHLPEIPAAAEVEENGMDVGEMNKKLLQKVEELTLYIIQQDKEMREVKKRLLLLEQSSQTR
ncbi:hypothetical protein [Chitinophaga sp.]|uniref:hypothetical protein n=1 Tax=Chitinophaga sp. TaxID=1869181 RepID=UPI0031D9A7F7